MKKILFLFLFLITLSHTHHLFTLNHSEQQNTLSIQEKTLYQILINLYKKNNLTQDSLSQLKGNPTTENCLRILSLRKQELENNITEMKTSRLGFAIASLGCIDI